MASKGETWRQQPRYECRIAATAVLDDGEVRCVVTDVSDGGARVQFAEDAALAVGTVITLRMPDREPRRATVRYVRDRLVGVGFAAPREVEQ